MSGFWLLVITAIWIASVEVRFNNIEQKKKDK